MWIRSSAALSEHCYQVTTPFSSHLLIHDQSTALVDCGVFAGGKTLVEEIQAALGTERTLDYLLLTHAHSDHCGGVYHLKQAYPALKILASPATADEFGKKHFIEECLAFNQSVCGAIQNCDSSDLEKLSSSLKVDQLIRDGDSMSLGSEVEIKVIGCPGHTDDSIAFFIRPDMAIAAGEALGWYNGRNQAFPCFLSSYHGYVISLDRILNLEVKVVSLAHAGAITGDMAMSYLKELRDSSKAFHELIRERMSLGATAHEVAETLALEWKEQGIAPEGPFSETMRKTVLEMVRVIADDR